MYIPFNVFLDSDGPIADFDADLKASGLEADVFKHIPGIYLWLKITKGASEAIAELKYFGALHLMISSLIHSTKFARLCR